MRIARKMMFAGFNVALLLASASAQAGSVVVDDSGGGTLLTVAGTASGGTISTNGMNASIYEVNGVTGLSLPTSYDVTITDGSLIGGVLSLTASGSATVGTGALDAVLNFTASGAAFNLLGTGYIVLTGTINSVTADNYPGYSFDPSMVGAAISLTITKTGTDYTQVFGHNGASVSDSGFGFQMNDGVPEPTSMTLLAVGVTGLVVFRLRFGRHRAAAS
jgi:hypothetical protein